ncbi:myb/SANT-like DNA-binding domain-containing protein 3 [Magallana gigas]|uniref:myb/SANT-like DNA-binding domain-containing protein 3 n=1 Tax=Magallana gigas TaxID=29159 RepID=UPI00334034D1
MAGKKGPNFTELEKCIIIDLVGSKKDTTKNKATDAKMIHKKNLEWENLAKEFNSRNDVNIRISTRLKSLWKNLKSRSKSAVAKERREKSKTGGGVIEGTIDKLSSAVREIIPLQINSYENVFDDDVELNGDIDNFNESQPPEKNHVGTASEPQASMSPATVSTQTMTTSSSKSTTASKRKCVEQEDVKKKMLDMAEEEHR